MLSSRFYLLLSLTTAICAIAKIELAEATQSPTANVSVPELTQQIAHLIDLAPDRQNLLAAALDRALASKQSGSGNEAEIAGGKPIQPSPSKQPKSKQNSQPSPTPKSKRDPSKQQSPEIIGQMRRPQTER